MSDKTINVTITQGGIVRALQLFRSELADRAGMVDAIIDAAFTLGANTAGIKTQEDADRIVAVRERLITTGRMEP